MGTLVSLNEHTLKEHGGLRSLTRTDVSGDVYDGLTTLPEFPANPVGSETRVVLTCRTRPTLGNGDRQGRRTLRGQGGQVDRVWEGCERKTSRLLSSSREKLVDRHSRYKRQ